ncbi:hypothetical protein Megpolyxen_01385 [Candidatus Megaera polyxenophila]|nr:hypothetical protein Megpolyxen_01385 [Candidatus Megaera polyxenophila]
MYNNPNLSVTHRKLYKPALTGFFYALVIHLNEDPTYKKHDLLVF